MSGDFVRGEGEFRDDRLFFVGCEDRYAPDQYFSFFRIPRIKVEVFPAVDDKSHAKYVVERMKKVKVDCEEDDEVWVVLDTDHCIKEGHFHSYEQALSEARRSGMNIAISCPCFEVWLACHHLNVDQMVSEGMWTAANFNEKLADAIGYDKTKLKSSDFPIETLPLAYRRAESRDEKILGGDKPDGVTTRVYKLWHNILLKASFAQLPDSLKELAAEIKGARQSSLPRSEKGRHDGDDGGIA